MFDEISFVEYTSYTEFLAVKFVYLLIICFELSGELHYWFFTIMNMYYLQVLCSPSLICARYGIMCLKGRLIWLVIKNSVRATR
jgi:hypothetical protein